MVSKNSKEKKTQRTTDSAQQDQMQKTESKQTKIQPPTLNVNGTRESAKIELLKRFITTNQPETPLYKEEVKHLVVPNMEVITQSCIKHD